jgi:VanZ family protein
MGRSLARAVTAVIAIVLCLALLHFYQPVSDTRLARELQNAGHALLFGAIALLALRAARSLGQGGARGYASALTVALVLGALSEWLQVASPVRDASVGDWLRDAAGALAALCLAAGWRQGAAGRSAPAVALTLVATLSVAAVAAPLWLTVKDYLARDRAFPVFCCFTGDWEQRFVTTNHIELAPAAPDDVPADGGFLRMTYFPARWPGLTVHEVYPDWSGYDTLAFDIYAETPAPVAIVLRVDDLGHDGVTFQDRFNRDLTVAAGMNRLRVPIAEILEAPAGRRMDPRRMKRVFLFADGPQTPFTVYWNGFRLLSEADARR